MTPAETLTAANKKVVAAAIRRQVKMSGASFEGRVASLAEELRKHFRTHGEKSAVEERELRQQAGVLQVECDLLFGNATAESASIKTSDSSITYPIAPKMLEDFASGRLSGDERTVLSIRPKPNGIPRAHSQTVSHSSSATLSSPRHRVVCRCWRASAGLGTRRFRTRCPDRKEQKR